MKDWRMKTYRYVGHRPKKMAKEGIFTHAIRKNPIEWRCAGMVNKSPMSRPAAAANIQWSMGCLSS